MAAFEEELVIERETLVPSEFFDDLLRALDATEQVPCELTDLARRPRFFERG
ncbi:MAG: hypothetical protein ACYCU8_00905 [Ferrimicrobium acidiphilum]